MINKTKELLLTLLLGVCIFLSACGQKDPVEPPSAEPSSEGTPAPLQWEDLLKPGGEIDLNKYYEYLGIEVPETDTSQEVPDNVILLGARINDYKYIYKIVNAFNQAQSEYKIEIKNYEDKTSMFLDLVRGQGCDLLVLTPNDLTILSDKSGLEDLTPYFEKSVKVSRENLFEGVLAAGTAGGKLAGVMPGFTIYAILVEKGYTGDGGWTIEEYLALIDKYPDIPLNIRGGLKEAFLWLICELSALPETYVNWEERTCDFENETFIQTIEMLKSYLERSRKQVDYDGRRLADALYKKQVQTVQITIHYGEFFSRYQDIRDTFLESFELAGLPNQDGEVKFPMPNLTDGSVLYSMNASSSKKEAAWLFLEYMLSDYQEAMLNKDISDFSVRRDLVERKLQEEIEAEVTDKEFRINEYTGEAVPKRGNNFTEEDKERVLYLLDHATPPTILQAGGTFREIISEELQAFFAGDKTAAEAAHLIQSRVSLYLSVN